MSATTRPTLRDTLAAGLAALPNTTPQGLTVLTSAPKRTTTLFPHGHSAAGRAWEVEYLVVVHSGLPGAEGENSCATASGSGDAGATAGSSSTPVSGSNVLAAAISAHVYVLPTSPPSAIVYISKVDSSGYAPPSRLTYTLGALTLAHFLSPATRPAPRVTATLFARAQGQYLFPNSVEGGKRVLRGLGLCGWWKSVYEEAARQLVASGVPRAQITMRYLLPSYSAAEARGMLPVRGQPSPVEWSYAPPFVSHYLPPGSLASLIPSLPDDPKTRFLDELVADAIDHPTARANGTNTHATASTANRAGTPPLATSTATPLSPRKRRKEKDDAAEEEERRRAYAALAKVPADEFWERLGFRQECASGDVTGFFSISVEPTPEVPAQVAVTDAGAAPQLPDAVATSAAASLSTDTPAPTSTPTTSAPVPAPAPATTSLPTTITPAPKPDLTNTLPQAIAERVLASLLNTDFGTAALAAQGTADWLASVRAIVVDEIGQDGWAACTATIPAKAGVVGQLKRKEETVTMLLPRKKRK